MNGPNAAFIRNAWYVAGLSDELAGRALVGRRLIGEPVLLFRDDAGAVHALGDRCPHRFAPLHLGRHDGDRIICGYHGLGFDRTGACVHNPHGGATNVKALAVPRYPVEAAEPGATEQTGSQSLHLFTPETESSTHYFYVGSLPRAHADEALAETFFSALRNAFLTEDKPMIDAQQDMIGATSIMDLKPALLPVDKAAVLARRNVERLIAAERALGVSA